ncbi:MAG: S4 domain-containing protein [Rhodocyclaceae bacterium]
MKPTRRPPAAATPEAPRRFQRAPDAPASPAGVRLSKVMVERGMCNRREADALIARGDVFVDGQRIRRAGSRVSPSAVITLRPRATLYPMAMPPAPSRRLPMACACPRLAVRWGMCRAARPMR